jgi:hypothetical protein
VHSVDLGRGEETADEAAVGPVGARVEREGALETLPPLRLVPLPHYAPPVAREPAAGAEREPQVHAQPVARGALDHLLAEPADLHDGRDPAPQQLGHREIDAGTAGLLVLSPAPDREHLEQARVPELRATAILDERAVERGAPEVGVGGDEARREHAVGGVDGLVRRPLEPRPHVEDPVSFEHDHAVAQQAVAAPIEGDDPAGPDGDASPRAHDVPTTA